MPSDRIEEEETVRAQQAHGLVSTIEKRFWLAS
jgi:hypothetical protein